MKRLGAMTVLAVLFGMTFFSDGYAQGQMMRGGRSMHKGMMMGTDSAMCPMGPGMGMGMMMPRVVATMDNAIFILMGNKLIKYDSNLNKKKEVILEVDEKDMQAMFENMQKMRSMCMEMMAPQSKEQENGEEEMMQEQEQETEDEKQK
ncbi:MAG: hypothetical protein GF401_12450 [Chitinivibrionales bacterium]|nr:hypothetical protein [Chitinivibrionales bacterium]